MKLDIKKGSTSKMVEVFIQDSSSTVGAGLTGLVFNSASLTAYYYLNDAASATSITLATMTLGTFASGGFVEVDATNMPGMYSIGIPDAALTGADSVVIYLKGATNMAPVVLEIQLVDYDPYDAAVMGMTDLVNSGRIDVLLDAIKAKTDLLSFTDETIGVDANAQGINDVELTGDGSATPFNV